MGEPEPFRQCDTCRFYRHQGDYTFDGGDCRRRSPVIASDSRLFQTAAWPTVLRLEWCGEYEPIASGFKGQTSGLVSSGEKGSHR